MWICVFECKDETFYWGPFKTLKAAERYRLSAQEQSKDYYNEGIWTHTVQQITKPYKIKEDDGGAHQEFVWQQRMAGDMEVW